MGWNCETSNYSIHGVYTWGPTLYGMFNTYEWYESDHKLMLAQHTQVW